MEKVSGSALKEQISEAIVRIYRAADAAAKPLRASPVSEVREVAFRDEKGVSNSAHVVFLAFVFLEKNRALTSAFTNAVSQITGRPCFVVAQRTIIHPKSKYNQRIPNNRTLTSVYEELLHDLVQPAQVIGKRTRFATGGKRLIKYHLNAESAAFMEPRAEYIKHTYQQLTGRNIALEFREEPCYVQVRRPRAQSKPRAAH